MVIRQIDFDYLASLNNNGLGYSKCSVGNRTQYVHRVVAVLKFGDIPSGFVVHHLDGNIKNNCFDNIVLVKRGEHERLHGAGKWMLGKKASLVTVNKHKKNYLNRVINEWGRFV